MAQPRANVTGAEVTRSHIARALSVARWSLSTITGKALPGVTTGGFNVPLLLGYKTCFSKAPASVERIIRAINGSKR